MLETNLINRLYEIVINLENSSLEGMQLILKEFSVNPDPTWNMRFYVLLTECLKEWAVNLTSN